jgi:hypothetical protein
MNTNVEVEDQRAIITSQAASPQESSNNYKPTYYSRIKQDAEAFRRLKEQNKLRYEARKAAVKELRQAGFTIELTKKQPPYKPTPEARKRYYLKYYGTHREAIAQRRKEAYAANPPNKDPLYIERCRAKARRYWDKKIKGNPEMLQRERERAHIYYHQKKKASNKTNTESDINVSSSGESINN